MGWNVFAKARRYFPPWKEPKEKRVKQRIRVNSVSDAIDPLMLRAKWEVSGTFTERRYF